MKLDVQKLATEPRHYDNFLQGYVDYTKHMEAPREYHLWTAVSIIAGALRSKCYIDMGYFKWKPNQFIIFVAPPGIVSKSTTSGVGTDLLREVPGINFGPTSVTWQRLLDKFQDVEETVKIGNAKLKQSCLTIEASELGTFLDFTNREMVDTIVDIWDAKDKPIERSTKGGGDQVVNGAWMNLIGCTTPSWVQESMPKYAIGGGFTSRSIFVYAENKQKLVAYPQDYVPKNQAVKRKRLIEDLTRISLIKGEFKLDKEAKEFGESWYDNHYNNPDEHLKSDVLAGYAARKQTHMHKIAMCLSAAENDSRIITKHHLQTALALLSYSEQNMLKVFNTITDDREAGSLQILKIAVANYPQGIKKKDLLFKLSSRMGYDSISRALDMGVAAGLFKYVVSADGDKIKPTPLLMRGGDHKTSQEDLDRINKFS